jgi:hypothetical protein
MLSISSNSGDSNSVSSISRELLIDAESAADFNNICPCSRALCRKGQGRKIS